MEPVCGSFTGACFPLVLILRAAKMPNTRIKAATMLNTTRRPALSHGTAKGFALVSRPAPRVVTLTTATSFGSGYFTMLPLNKFLGID